MVCEKLRLQKRWFGGESKFATKMSLAVEKARDRKAIDDVDADDAGIAIGKDAKLLCRAACASIPWQYYVNTKVLLKGSDGVCAVSCR